MKAKLSVLAAVVSLVLAGCGGGGGGSTSTPTSPSNPTPPVTTPPVTTPPVSEDPTALQTTVPAPTYAADSVQLAAFTALNKVRAAYGVGQLAENTALNTAAQSHAQYLLGRLQAADYNAIGHTEDSTKPGFTGVTAYDRALFAKFAPASDASVSENLVSMVQVDGVSSVAGAVAIETLLSGPYHRLSFFDGSRVIGFGHSSIRIQGEGGTRQTVVANFSRVNGTRVQAPANDWIGLWPADKSTGVMYSFAGESPNPIPSNNGACAGYPVSVQVKDGQTLTTGSFTIKETVSGKAIPAQVSTKSNDPNPAFARANSAYLIPYAPLKLNTSYTVQFSGARDSTPFDKTWTFTTRADNTKLIFGCDPS